MADTVTGPTTLFESDKKVVYKLVVESDGTGSTTVFADVSALTARGDGTSVAYVNLQQVWFACDTGDGGDTHARLDYEDSDADIPMLGLVGTGHWDFSSFGGIQPNTTSNSNEYDVNLVVPSQADDGNMYTVVAEFNKVY
jgi:hypothetical protein